MLREEGLETRAVFVDIDAPPLGLTLRKSGEQLLSHAEHEHGEMNRVAAMRALSKSYDGDLAPDTKVAGYGYHDADPAELVKTVAALSRAHAG